MGRRTGGGGLGDRPGPVSYTHLETLDVTIPGKPIEVGHKHPMYTVLDEIKDIFIGMGFDILDGPEIERCV